MKDNSIAAATVRTSASPQPRHRVWPDWPFFVMLSIIGSVYVLLLVGMLAGNFGHLAITPADGEPENVTVRAGYRIASPILAALKSSEIQFAIKLTLASCFFSAILSVIVAVPLGYLISRFRFPGRNLLDALLDVPIVLPPLVVGLSLLMLFQLPPVNLMRDWFVFQVPGVVLAQFMVAAAFAIRTMRATFDQIDPRAEQVALTLGCTRAQAFTRVTFPLARQGMLTAGMMAWARSMGEFGPLLIFAGATRHKTEVLSTTVFLELSIGDLNAAVAVSLLMVFAAVAVLLIARTWGSRAMSL
jgi:molybdate transport system permease protein